MCTVAVKVCIVVVVLIMLRVHLCGLAVVTVVTAVVTVVTAVGVGTFGTVVLGFRLLTLQYLQTFRSSNEVRPSAAFLHLVQVAIVTVGLGFRLLTLQFHQTFTDLHFFRRVSLHQLLTFPHFHSTQHLFFFQD